jgi:hypothetical protein
VVDRDDRLQSLEVICCVHDDRGQSARIIALSMKHHELGMRLINLSGISYHLPETAAKDLYKNVDILITKYH